MGALRAGPVVIPDDDIEIRFSRSGGPGGQNVNKRDTRVEVFFDLGDSRALTTAQRRRARERLGARVDDRGRVRVVSAAQRTQAANRAVALERLAALIEDALRPPPPPRKPTKPSARARARRLDEKAQRARTKRLRRTPPREAD